MRIISKFHDYYDSVMRNGQDFELIYLRHTTEEPLPSKWPGIFPYCPVSSAPSSYDFPQLDVQDLIIGFCGKIYPAILLRNDWNITKIARSAICYSLEEVDAFIKANYKKKHFEAYSSLAYSSWRSRNWCTSASRARFKEFFEEVNKKRDFYKEFFLEKKVPIFIASKGKLTLNPQLKQWEFVRVFNTFAAFQELQMYLGGLASPEKPIPGVSDKDLLECKGFNKWSFRKPPSEDK